MSVNVPEYLQKEIRAVLLSKIGGVPLSELKKDYKKLIGHDLDYNSLGFCSLKQLLLSIPDVARVVLVTKTNTEKVYGVSSAPPSSMNYTERKARYIPKEGEILITADANMNANFNKSYNSNPAMAGKQSLRQYVEENIICNKKNLWTLCFPLKEHMADEEYLNYFAPYGTVAEISFTQKYGFVRYTTKQSAVDAFISLKDELDIRLATEGGNSTKKNPHTVDTKERTSLKSNSLKKTDVGINSCSRGVGRGLLGCPTDRYGNNKSESAGRGYKLGSHSSSNGNNCSSVTNQSVAPRMLQSPNGNPRIKQFSLDNVANDKYSMPDLEEIDVLPSLESCDITTDKQQISGSDEDYNSTPSFRTSHQQCYSDDRSHRYREGDGRNQLELPQKKQYECNKESYNLRVSDDAQKQKVFELFVKNFPYGTSPDKLVQPFLPYGAKGVEIVRNQYGRGTLALVQFTDYEQAAQAIANLDGTAFCRRSLVIGFQQTAISQEDIVRKRLKKLVVKVKFDNNQGSNESPRREVMLENDDNDDAVAADVVVDNSAEIPQNKIRNTSHNVSLTSSLHSHGIQHVQRPRGIKQHAKDRSYQYVNNSHKKASSDEDNDLSVSTDSSGASHANRQEVVSCSSNVAHSKQEPAQSGYARNMSHNATVKQQTPPSGEHGVKHGDGIPGLVSVNNCNQSNQQGILHKEDQACIVNKVNTVQPKGLRPSPPTNEPTWVSPPGRTELGFNTYNDFEAAADQSHLPESGCKNDSSIPVMMRCHIMEQMINDVCPGHRLFTVNDMLPQLQVLVTYKENETYFWGSIISGHFKQNVERLYRLSQDFEKLSHNHPLTGNKGMAQYDGEWFRVWLYDGNKVNADVMYVDYGNSETVERSKISGLPEKYWQLPPLAVPFKLEDPLCMTVTENKIVPLTVVASAEENHIIVVKT